MRLLQAINFNPEGKLACVIGRSILVGSPLLKLLSIANATTIQVHSKTKNPVELCKQADLLIVAAGQKNLIKADWVKEGAVVIDVGIHRDEHGLCGDVDFASVQAKASYITPVPGGVGPMTIACLLENTIRSWKNISSYSKKKN